MTISSNSSSVKSGYRHVRTKISAVSAVVTCWESAVGVQSGNAYGHASTSCSWKWGSAVLHQARALNLLIQLLALVQV